MARLRLLLALSGLALAAPAGAGEHPPTWCLESSSTIASWRRGRPRYPEWSTHWVRLLRQRPWGVGFFQPYRYRRAVATSRAVWICSGGEAVRLDRKRLAERLDS